MSTLGVMAALTMMMLSQEDRRLRPHLQNRILHPPGYGVHISKAERKGKTPEQLQALRLAKQEALHD